MFMFIVLDMDIVSALALLQWRDQKLCFFVFSLRAHVLDTSPQADLFKNTDSII